MAVVEAMLAEVPVIAGGMLVKKLLDRGNQLPPDALRFFSTFRDVVDIFIVEAHGEQTGGTKERGESGSEMHDENKK